MIAFTFQFMDEPCLGQAPVPVHRLGRHAEDRCALLGRQASEEPHLDHLCFARVKPGQCLDSPIQEHNIQIEFIADSEVLSEIDAREPPVRPGIVNEDAPHDLGADCQEMRSVSPFQVPNASQSQVGFIHQGGGLNRVAGTFALQMAPRDPVQLRIGQFDNLPDCGLISRAPRAQKLRDLSGRL